MPADIVGQQLRFRVMEPDKFERSTFRTQDVGTPGKLQRIAGKLKSNHEWATQAWRLNLADYKSLGEIHGTIGELYAAHQISEHQVEEGTHKVDKWWVEHHGR